MAHELATTADGRTAMAYVGETPWHGLGATLTANSTIAEWRHAAGLDYTVERSPVLFAPNPVHNVPATPYTNAAGKTLGLRGFQGQDVLYRSDTGAPLATVSDRYQVVQPGAVLDFFETICQAGGFSMETAGVLFGGKRVWALARVHEGAAILGRDTIKPYVLLTTSYDGTLSTTAKLMTVRVVCNNTLRLVLSDDSRTSSKAVRNLVTVPHSTEFRPDDVRQQLGIVANSFDRFIIESRLLAAREIDLATADQQTVALMAGPGDDLSKPEAIATIRKSTGYKAVMGLFDGEAKGADMAGPTLWGWVNAVTEWTDWQRGRAPDSRIASAWFGPSDALKAKAFDQALALATA